MQPKSQDRYSEIQIQAVLNKAIVSAGWSDAPHLDDKEKMELLASCEPHLRESRSQGIPHLGSGAIYPINLEDILIDPFQIKPWYFVVRASAMINAGIAPLRIRKRRDKRERVSV